MQKEAQIQVELFFIIEDRCKKLYDLSKNSPKKKDISTNDYQFSKEEKECTFSPNITKVNAKTKAKPKTTPPIDPNSFATIERLKKARKEKERVNKLLERGSENQEMRFDIEHNKFKNTKYLHAKTHSTNTKLTPYKTRAEPKAHGSFSKISSRENSLNKKLNSIQ